MKKRQLMGLWIVGVLWALNLLIWYSFGAHSWGLVQFLQTTIFWGVICLLAYIVLGQDGFGLKKEKGYEAGHGKTQIKDNETVSEESGNSGGYRPVEYYSVSLRKLIILSTCTFGLYHVYWHYKNWKAIRVQAGVKITPWLRGWCCILFSYVLFKRILNSAAHNGFKIKYSAGQLAILYILLMVLWRLPDPYWLISFLSFIPLVYLQKAINFNNSAVNPDAKRDNKFSGKALFVVVIFAIYFSLYLLTSFTPFNLTSLRILWVGKHSFSDQAYQYSISTPKDWFIIQKKDFGKLDKELEVLESGIGLVDLQGKYFCHVAAENLNENGDQPGIEQLRGIFEKAAEDSKVDLDSNERVDINGHEAFELRYHSHEGGQDVSHMTLYVVYGHVGINFSGWSAEADPADGFNTIKRIAESIK